MKLLIRWCLENRAVVVLLNLVLMGAGVAGLLQINQELLPSVQLPTVFVLLPEPGASSEQVDRDVAQPVSAGLSGLPGKTHVSTTATQGFAQVNVVFDLNSSVKDDLDAVNQRLQQVSLPPSVQHPMVHVSNVATDAPVMIYSLATADGDLARATAEADDVIVPALSGAAGASQVSVSGGAQPAVALTLDSGRLRAKNVSLQQVQQALSGAQVDVPAGESARAGQTVPVEVLGSLRTVDDLKALVVSTPPAPPVRLGDVATATQDQALADGIMRRDGLPALQIQVFRAANGNAITLSNDVQRRVAHLRLDQGDDLRLLTNSAADVQTSVNDLVLEGVLGAVLAVVVIFVFLRNVRATLVTAVALPTSVLVAVLGTALGGFSLNILTLAGLTIAVGRIVDDAIVVLENSYRHLQLGEQPLRAAYRGATEVSSAVVSSTLTTVGVFLPIGLVGGIISRFFLAFSITVTLALLASLLVALTLVPILVSLVLRARPAPASARARDMGTDNLLARAYRPVLAWSLRRAWRKAAILVVALALLAGSAAALVTVPRNSFDVLSSNELDGSVQLPPGTSAQQTSDRLRAFETAAQADPAVRTTQVSVASSNTGSGTSSAFTSSQASISVWVASRADAGAAARRLQARLNQLYGAGNAEISPAQQGPATNFFDVSLEGHDGAALGQASAMVVAALSKDSELTNVTSDVAPATPELLVSVDPAKATARGVSSQVVASLVSTMLASTDVGTLGTGGPAVRLRLDPAATSADQLGSLPVTSGTELKDVATVTDTMSPTAISRTDGVQQVAIGSEVVTADVQGASDRAAALVQGLSLPPGVQIGSGAGAGLDIRSAFNQMLVAIGVAVAVVFLILVAFFRSVVTPLVILLTMPLALIGSSAALYAFGQALGLPALLGVLMLLGIVVSNAILFIDFVERNRADRDVVEAVVLAGGVRVRPIVMTALATIVALVPVAAGVSSGGGGGLISRPLALVVEGGLISSTFLTLLVIPVVYSLLRGRATRAARLTLEASEP